MKMQQSTTKIIRTEQFEESYFGIDSDEDLVHIFNILRNKIYTDKILACIREYSTNAQDAHIEAGIPDKPIDVILPSKFSPQFTIRDYGKGLPEEAIRQIYVKYGKSTKRNSNAFNGQLGLGCKAAFAYGDSFQITSYYGGKEMHFEAYIDESKIGKVAKLQEKSTSEPTGIKITIPVKPADIEGFTKTAQRFYLFFSPQPNTPGVTLDKLHWVHEGSCWKLPEETAGKGGYVYSTRDLYRLRGPVAVMGNVSYPIDMNVMGKSVPAEHWRKIQSLRQTPVTIEFPIGELSIASSREGLEYDKRTMKAIVARMEKIGEELGASISKDFDKVQDIYDAKRLYGEYFSYGGKYNNLSQFLPEGFIKWNGKKIDSAVFSLRFSRSSPVKATGCDLSSSTVSGISQWKLGRGQAWSYKDPVTLVINDAPDKWILRLRNHLESNKDKYKRAYVFTVPPGGKKDWENFLESNCLEENKHVVKLSEIEPLKTRAAGAVKKDRHKAKIFKFLPNEAHSTQAWKAWEISDVDIKSPGYYVTINRFKSNLGTNAELYSILRAATSVFDVNLETNLVGIKPSIEDKISKHRTPLESEIRKLFKEKIKEKQFITDLSRGNLLKTKDGLSDKLNILIRTRLWESLSSHPDENTKEVIGLLEALSQVRLPAKTKSMMLNANTLIETLGLYDIAEPVEEKYLDKTKNNLATFFKRYPMLEHLDRYMDPKVSDVLTYMSLVDRSKEND